MKKLFALLLAFCLLLAGCAVTEPQINQTQPSESEQQTQPSDYEQPSQSTGSTEKPAPEPEEFRYQVNEERGFNLELLEENKEEEWYSTFCVIRSVEELKDQVGKSLAPGETLPEWIGEYDDTFFETNTLINVSIFMFMHNHGETHINKVTWDDYYGLGILIVAFRIGVADSTGKYCNCLIEINRKIEDSETVVLNVTPIVAANS